jgi:hypothetical protein
VVWLLSEKLDQLESSLRAPLGKKAFDVRLLNSNSKDSKENTFVKVT